MRRQAFIARQSELPTITMLFAAVHEFGCVDPFQTFGLTNCCCANGHREPHFACRKFLL
jgi:hypothetical protein